MSPLGRRDGAGDLAIGLGGDVAEERELVHATARGDGTAFRRLYDAFADRVFRYALTLVRDRHLAEEVVQDTMLAVWKGAGRFAGRSEVSTWVFGIARRRAYDLLRREARGRRETGEGEEEGDPREGIERAQAVRAAVDRLPEGEREVVFLTFYEGWSYREIAILLGIPEGTVKSRMFHAKRRLAEALV